jgi:uncharacterized glyoxalase superfamily protein PhnB
MQSQFDLLGAFVPTIAAWFRVFATTSKNRELIEKYGVKAEPPADRPWGMRDFVIVDPTSVLWRIAQNNK